MYVIGTDTLHNNLFCIKKRGSNSKTIGIVYWCETGHIWSFLRAAKTMTS